MTPWRPAAMALANCAYGFFAFPETMASTARRPFEWKRANPVGSLLHLKKYPAITGLAVSIFIIYVAAHAVMSTWSYYGMYRFNWDEKMVGLSLGAVGLLVGIVQGGLIRVINPRLGNERSIYIGLGLYATGMLLFGIATNGWMMFVFLVPYCLGGIVQPALQAVMAGHVPPNEQGELQGGLTSLMSAAAIIGPLLMNNLFFFFTHSNAPLQLPGAPFLLASVLMAVSAIIAYRTLHPNKSIV